MQEPALSKRSVNYTDASPMKFEKCSTCSMFLPADRCTLVKGPIKAGGWCEKYFTAATDDVAPAAPVPLIPRV
jgi:hypothetical protein